MSTMTVQQFVSQWSKIQLKEKTAAQSHFNDVCALVGHALPLEADPTGKVFTFEADADKTSGEHGWADAYYRGRFIWEYKGPHKDLDKAYQQLLLYKDSLGNPPLLITSDMQVIVVHTNFTNTVKKIYTVTLDTLVEGSGLEILRAAFFDPQKLRPSQTPEQVTKATADEFIAAAHALQTWGDAEGRPYDPERLAHFLGRLLFCLFAEDIGLLSQHVFTRLAHANLSARQFEQSLRQLFAAMRTGGVFGMDAIPYFDGGLFDDDFVPDHMPGDVLHALRRASEHDWASIDPSIFGTLFERIIDESKRAQLGAHYTSKEDILLVVEPVLMEPLRRKWQTVKWQAAQALKSDLPDSAHALLQAFSDELAALRVLDPACGSGNFLYIALRQLMDLQKQVIAFAGQHGLPDISLTVGPQQLFGIEINPYAHQLAQITMWIGYLQWRSENGFQQLDEPILKPLQQVERKDAILASDTSEVSETSEVCEPSWPPADVIIGNPPFLGGNKIRAELGNDYVDALFKLYEGRVPAFSDLVCYWFEKARSQIEARKAKRAGLLATNSIRGGVNRRVLERIKETGDIFWAQSNRDWLLDGAAVNVSMVGFDNGSETNRYLDDKIVDNINPDLTGSLNLTNAHYLQENLKLCFIGTKKAGAFDIDSDFAHKLLSAPVNPGQKPNSDVVFPWLNGKMIVGREKERWIINFGDMSIEESSKYGLPFEYVRQNVYPERQTNNEERARVKWWQHRRPATEMREAVARFDRYIATPRVSKYRIFTWVPSNTIPDDGIYIFARSDDYFFGVLHSHAHEIWALRQGTSLEDRPRYTPTTTFETFPFPWPPGQEPGEAEEARLAAIAEAARQLDSFRQEWLNPTDPSFSGPAMAKILQRRTLTNLYNALGYYREKFKGRQHSITAWQASPHAAIISLDEIETLDHIHATLDHAVLDAYGWPHALNDEQILERLLALNLARARGNR